MAAWLPIVKTAIPIIAEIVSVTRPMFTKKPDEAGRDPLTSQQIEELQKAATQNSESVSELATQVKTTFEAMESAAQDLQVQLAFLRRLCLIAICASAVSVAISLYLLGG